jgi:alkylated DNA repair dioxygenase AlkB
MNLELFSREPQQQLLPYDGEAWLYPNFFTDLDLAELNSSIQWQEQQIFMYGQWVIPKRLVCLYTNKQHSYNNMTHPILDWPQSLLQLADKITAVHGEEFNAVLCNLYRDGSDYVGWHSDDENNMDQSCIASVSVGATRSFKFRHKTTKEQISVELEQGDLLLMRYCQQHWHHALPKRLKVDTPRINLTFRRII